MENKINIAELLKDCPKCTKLYSPLCGECRVFNIYDGLGFDVICGDDTVYNFLYDGRYNIMGECCIFPSKDQRDWSKFQRPFKDGDVVVIEGCYGYHYIVFHTNAKNYITTGYNCFRGTLFVDNEVCKIEEIKSIRKATEEEKTKLFDAIKANGYRWNAETKTLEKLIVPKFKVGDRIVHKVNKEYPFTITEITDDCYKGGYRYCVLIEQQDNFELDASEYTNDAYLKGFIKKMKIQKSLSIYFGRYGNNQNI